MVMIKIISYPDRELLTLFSYKVYKQLNKEMRKIEHIGIAVKSLETSNLLFEKLFGVPAYKQEEVASEGVKTSFFMNGPNKIELLEATNADSPIAKFIDKKGEGIHHIAFDVADIISEMERLKGEGFILLKNRVTTEGATKMNVLKTSQAMISWLVQHIMATDKALAVHLRFTWNNKQQEHTL